MQTTDKMIQSLTSISKWGKICSIFLFILGGLSILVGFWLILPAALGVFLIMGGIHVQQSVKAAEQIILEPNTPFEDLLEQYSKMIKMQALYAISSIASIILTIITTIFLFIFIGGFAFFLESPNETQYEENIYNDYDEDMNDEVELNDFF
ncbi:hypothetical protein [Bacillus sp. NPDC077027]|uniref:hypothetical protein n=1 Tax=Bacillus sp. NPDC077027 TaxID=3390548 RepID=UPI003D08CBD3